MRKSPKAFFRTIPVCVVLFFQLTACSDQAGNQENSMSNSNKAGDTAKSPDRASRGEYLVNITGCSDCHSPKNFTEHGPVIDTTRLLSGYPASSKLPPVDMNALKPGSWALMAQDATSFVGPWGVSFAANLTPDSATGIGAWSEETFINTLRTGKHLGQPAGRRILPPMPWYFTGKMTDEDLSSVYVYLQSLPPISNKVPQPLPPDEVGKLAGK